MGARVTQTLVESFFHADTGTFTHVAHAGPGSRAAIIDPVLDYDAAAARTTTASADKVLDFVRAHRLRADWILETHTHADHLSAAGHLRDALDAPLAIGRGVVDIQSRLKVLYGLGAEFAADGSQFDRLLADGDLFAVGALDGRAIATPGHTPDSLTYVIGDAAFVGDTLFAPDIGTARCDFPGGDASDLYRSIRRILALPAATRIFLCHDYPPDGRAPTPAWTIDAQLEGNVHVRNGTTESGFVALRNARDSGLPVPRLMLPALQVNIRGGRLPGPDGNGIRYLRLPLDRIGAGG